MKKNLIAITVAAALVAPQAFAQANNFTGLSVAANLNLATTSTEMSDGGEFLTIGDTSQNASLQAAYGLALGNSAVLGFGATLGLGDLKAGTVASFPDSASIKAKNMYAIYVEPGYALTPTTLVYGKIAYLGMKAELSESGAAVSYKFKGAGFGAGIRTMLDKNLFLQVEIVRSDYKDKVIDGGLFAPSITTGSIGVGYKF